MLGAADPVLRDPSEFPAQSATLNDEVVRVILADEIRLRRVRGPFAVCPFQKCIIHQIFLVTKPTGSIGYRLIHDLSHPFELALNEFIPPEARVTVYPTIDTAVEHILRLPSPAYLGKVDLRDAFRNIPLSPSQYPLTVFRFEGRYYYDTRLPFGSGSSCKIFQEFSSALADQIQLLCPAINTEVVLDDYIFVGPSSFLVNQAINSFLELCEKINLPINHGETVYATTCLVYLGIEFDTVSAELRLDRTKLQKLKNTLRKTIRRKKITKQQCQEVVGFLNWCCRVIRPGRAFLRHLIDLGSELAEQSHHTELTAAVREDLRVWYSFMRRYNGVSFMRFRPIPPTDSLNFFSDAAGSCGYSCLFSPSWTFGIWPQVWNDYPIHIKEIYPIFLGLSLWSDSLRNVKLTLRCDNLAVVVAVNKQTAKDRRLMFFVRKIVLLCLRYNILLNAEYIPSASNKAADLLSRGLIAQFHGAFPEYSEHPTPIPSTLQPQFLMPS